MSRSGAGTVPRMSPYPVGQVVRYGAHAEQIADVRLPRGADRGVLVLLVHGGFWRQEYDRHHTDPLADDLAGRGFTVASVEYRRIGGDGGWPATFDDVAAAVDTVPGRVRVITPQADKVVLMGHSAGGHLVLWAAGRHQLPVESRWAMSNPPALQGILALAPVADLVIAHQLDLDDGAVDELLGGGYGERPDRYAQADPTTPLPPAASTVIVHGDADQHVPIALSLNYLAALRSRGTAVRLEVVEDGEHFALIEPGSSSWPRVLAALDSLAG